MHALPCNRADAVTVVGYGYDTASKKSYYIVKNSWGTNWGESVSSRHYDSQCYCPAGANSMACNEMLHELLIHVLWRDAASAAIIP